MSATTTAPNIIEGHVLYGIEEAKARMRWTKHAMRTARRNGLKVKYAGGRAYVLGRDLIDFIANSPETYK